jgi:hypothetical protein
MALSVAYGVRNSRLMAAPPGAKPGSTIDNIQSKEDKHDKFDSV